MGYATDIFDNVGLSFYAKGLYCLLAKFADKNGKCWPSLLKLQEMSGLSKPTIIKGIKELSDSGQIEVEHRFNNGMKTSSRYLLKNLGKSDVNGIYHDVNDIDYVNADKSSKTRGKGDLPRGKRGLPTDVNDIDINLSILTSPINNNITDYEKGILDYLPNINGYPFDSKKDLAQVREWLKSYPVEHVLSELEKFNSWWRDKESSFKGKKNFRSSITNWLKRSKVEIKPVRKSTRLDLD